MTRMLAWILCVSLLLGTPVMATDSGESNTSDSRPILLADMGNGSKDIPVDGLRYLPRQGDQLSGTITKYEIWASTDGDQFVKIASGDWAADHAWKSVSFTPYIIRYVKLVDVEACDEGGAKFASAAEIRVTQAEAGETYKVESFTEDSKRGELAIKSGDGTVTFQNGEGANSYTTVSKVDGILTKALFMVGRFP